MHLHGKDAIYSEAILLSRVVQETGDGLLPLILVSSAHATNHVYQLAPSIISLKIMLEYGLSTFEAGLILLAFNLPYALLQAFFGTLSRRLGRKNLMVSGFIVTAAAFAGASVSESVLFIAAAFIVAGIGCSTYHALGIPLVSDLFPLRRGEALGYHQTGGSIGSVVAPLTIGAFAEILGWRSACLILSLLGIVVAPVLWYRLRDSHVTPVEGYRIRLLELKEPLVLIFAAAIYVVAFRGLQLFGLYYFTDDRGKGLGVQGYLLMSLSNVAGIFSGPVCGRLSDTIDRKKVIVALVAIEGVAAFGLVFLAGIPLYLTVVVFGFAFYGLLATMDAFMADIVRPPSLFGTMVGINVTASFIVSSVLSPILGASINALGYDLSFTILALVSLLSLPLIILTGSAGEKPQHPSAKVGEVSDR